MAEIEDLERELTELRSARVTESVVGRLLDKVVSLRDALSVNVDAPVVHVAAPELPPATVNVEATVVNVPPAEVRVAVPDQSAALAALTGVLEEILVALSEPVNVEFQRNPNGTLKGATVG